MLPNNRYSDVNGANTVHTVPGQCVSVSVHPGLLFRAYGVVPSLLKHLVFVLVCVIQQVAIVTQIRNFIDTHQVVCAGPFVYAYVEEVRLLCGHPNFWTTESFLIQPASTLVQYAYEL